MVKSKILIVGLIALLMAGILALVSCEEDPCIGVKCYLTYKELNDQERKQCFPRDNPNCAVNIAWSNGINGAVGTTVYCSCK